MDCKGCENKTTAVPYLVYEGEMARGERNLKRLWITVILLICLLVGSNAGWLIYESQFMTEEYTVESNTDGGGTAIANASGEVTVYGEGEGYGQAARP